MFDDLEQERPLDRIVRVGLARMDAAVKGVIAKHSTPFIVHTKHKSSGAISEATMGAMRQNYERFNNQRLMTEMARRQGAMGFNALGNQLVPGHIKSGAESQLSGATEWLTQEQADKRWPQ